MQVGKYKVIGRLGVGGMAEVFLATLGGIGGFQKTVVIKTILPNLLEDDKYVEMFLDEARVAANLNHPNIAQIYEIDEADGRPFIAMEYVKGPSLGQIIRRALKEKQLKPRLGAKIISYICLALDYAHNAKDALGNPLGIVHRDVTPHNVVVSLEGVPKLLDFGVAKSKDKLVATKAGTIKGKLQYMPVEQIKGTDVDCRADVFAAGVCLYRVTTGRLPFDGENEAARTQAIIEGIYPAPSELVERYPPALEAVIHQALARDRNDRLSSARVLHEAIETWLASSGGSPSADEIAGWVSELFPRFDEESHDRAVVAYALSVATGDSSRRSHNSNSTPGSSSSSRSFARHAEDGIEIDVDGGDGKGSSVSRVSAASAASVVGRSLGMLVAGMLMAVAAALGVVYFIVTKTDLLDKKGGDTTQVVATITPEQVNETARKYLDEAQKYTEQSKYRDALAFVDRAAGMNPTDPDLQFEITRSKSDIEGRRLLAGARNAMKLGDVDRAMEELKNMLELDPGNDEALTLLRQARDAQSKKLAAAEADEEEPEEVADKGTRTRRPVARTAPKYSWVSVTADPPATVFVDGAPYGRTPLMREQLSPGAHRIEVREGGFVTEVREVKLSAGKTERLSFTLKKDTSTQVAMARAATKTSDPPKADPVEKVAVVEEKAAAEPEPPPEPKVVKPPEDEVKVAAVVKAPEPVEPEKAAYQPTLPARVRIKEAGQLDKVLAAVEREVIKAGGASHRVRGCTDTLRQDLVAGMNVGGYGQSNSSSTTRTNKLPVNQKNMSVELYPLAMFGFILEEANAGKSKTAIASSLRSAHTGGRLRALSGT